MSEDILNKESIELSQGEKIELLSEDVQEIMGHVPNWIVRRGVTVILITLIMLIAGSFVFKYPDVITSDIVITSENPSTSIVARSSGKIDNLLVKNQQTVQQGEVLAVLENAANSVHVTDLKHQLEVFSAFFTSPLGSFEGGFPINYSLGTVQTAFSSFQRQFQNYQDFLKTDLIGKKIHSVRLQYQDYGEYGKKLKEQAFNQEKALVLTRNQLSRDSSLFAGGTISVADYEKSEQSYLKEENSYQNLLATVANTQMQMNLLNYQVIDLETQQSDLVKTSLNTLKEAFDNLKAAITEWEKQYVLISPIEGKVSFNQYWTKYQYIRAGEIVFTVVPLVPRKIIGRVKLPVSGSGKVKTGQKVLIRLANYPNTEFGMLEGKLELVSLVPEITDIGAVYTAIVSLPAVLITNYGNMIPFSQEMQGTAEIVTDNLSLFDRLINPVKSAYHKGVHK